MGETVSELRRWLKELQPPAARLLVESNEVLRNRTHLARSTPGRRAVAAIQSWAGRASGRELRAVAACATVAASQLLAAQGWPDAIRAQPDESQLAAMLEELEPPLAEFALFGLLLEDFPASAVAKRARASLSAAAAMSPAKAALDEQGYDHDATGDHASVSADADEDLTAVLLLVSDATDAQTSMLETVNGSRDSDLGAALARHEEANTRLRDRLAELGVSWSPRQGLPRASALIQEAIAQRQDARRLAAESEFAHLSEQHRVLSAALERDQTPEAAEAFREKLAAIEAVLCAMEERPPQTAAVTSESPSSGPTLPAVASVDPDFASTRTPPATQPSTEEASGAADDEIEPLSAAPFEASGETDRTVQSRDVPTSHDDVAPGIAVPLAAFIRAGRLDEAYFLVRAHEGPDSATADALAYAAAAFRCRDAAEANTVAVTFDAEWQAGRFRGKPVADTLVAVAAIRLGAVIGWAPAALAGRPTTADSPWRRLATIAAEAVQRGQTVSPGPGGTAEERADRKVRLRGEAGQLLQELPMRTVKYQRATNVLRHLVRAGDGIAGRVLQAVVDWVDGVSTSDRLREVVAEFQSVPSIAHINHADRSLSRAAKEPITAGALQRLEQHLDDIALIAATAVGIADTEDRARPDDPAAARDLGQLLLLLSGQAPPAGPSGAGLGLLRDWLTTAPDTGPGLSEDAEPLQADTTPLLAAYSLTRGGTGYPEMTTAAVPAIIGLLSDLDAATVVHEYNSRGEIGLSRSLLAAASAGRVPAILPPAVKEATELAKVITAEEARWAHLCEDAYQKARDLHARVWSMKSRPRASAVGEATADEVAARLEVLGTPSPDRAYGRVHAELSDIAAGLKARLDLNVDHLRTDLNGLGTTLPPRDRARIEDLLDRRDVIAATELLVLAGQEGRLPTAENDGGEDLCDLVELTARGAAQGERETEPLSASWFARQATADGARDDGVRLALEGWEDLAKQPGQEQRNLPRVLRALGLECKSSDISFGNERTPTGVRKFRVNCRPPRDGYVAAFGSSAPGAYTVLMLSNPGAALNPAKAVADWVADEPTIVLCLRPVPPEGWRSLLARSRRQPHMALVVDPAVFGLVVARANQSFRALQRVTLPWTGRNPYTPFAAGLVPPEVFHGRTGEMDGVKDPFGPLFVYGGRQLGKTAMLQRVTDEFARGIDSRTAVYIDLKAEGVGDVEAPEHIWVTLAKALRAHGIITQRTSDNAGGDVIAEQVRRWLHADPARRLLVLADESDAFMAADHRNSPPFRTVDKIKGLMEDTNRRFKIVFAGLHQVQRFVHLSNTPLAHGGEPIRIGPLDAAAARRLVVEPLAAIGYVFDDDDRLVWRILAHTNCQASLIQIFCDQLVRELAEQGGEALPITVTDDAVDRTAAAVRPVIAQRLRFTINLLDRYRVLMLVLALRSIDDGYSRSYGLPEILSEAKRYWGDGFKHTTTADLQITLEEMIGLGVVVGDGDGEYGVRSPNLVAMLGSRDQLERELTETSFDAQLEYDPNVARRSLANGGVKRFSPLTERQMARIVRPGRSLITATKEQGADRVHDALKSFTGSKDRDFEWCASDRLASRLTEIARRGRQPILGVDGREASATDLADVARQLSAYVSPKGLSAERTALLLVDPRQAGLPELRELESIRPVRWTADSLRSWPDCPATDAIERRALITATGGWYDHVERLIHEIDSGTELGTAVDRWTAGSAGPDFARRHLELAGVDRDVRRALDTWVAYLDKPEPIPEADLESILGDGAGVIQAMDALVLLDRDESGVALNPATFRSIAVLGREP